MPAAAFEAAARRAGRSAPVAEHSGIPDRCGLDELARLDAGGIAAAWARSSLGEGVTVPLGRSERGTVLLDLVAHGPHLLVAGTTGSGKSEFLRTLVAAAAATHSPGRLTFLLVDFKGGSGLEPLAGLPHCVGLVTDLAGGGMDRALASLRAELKRRERMLGRVRAADVVDYARLADDLPRLVLVVDEFRMLVEEAPAALAELMRIATVGRSLGMHLVMATQRPQGALSADIRANVATSIVLRMQHDAESSDVLGSPLAARIPAGRPGRAYLAVGGDEPLAFQSASLGLSTAAPAAVRIADAHGWPEDEGADALEVPPTPAEAARPLVEAARTAWAAAGGAPVRKPVAPPLPDELTVAEAAACSARSRGADTPAGMPAGRGRHTLRDRIHLGLVDVPHEQRLAPLDWDPSAHGHLALVGPPAAGGAGALSAVVGQLADGGAVRHLYLLDGDGSLAGWRDHPRVGAHVSLGDLRRAARVVARLGEECAQRPCGSPARRPRSHSSSSSPRGVPGSQRCGRVRRPGRKKDSATSSGTGTRPDSPSWRPASASSWGHGSSAAWRPGSTFHAGPPLKRACRGRAFPPCRHSWAGRRRPGPSWSGTPPWLHSAAWPAHCPRAPGLPAAAHRRGPSPVASLPPSGSSRCRRSPPPPWSPSSRGPPGRARQRSQLRRAGTSWWDWPAMRRRRCPSGSPPARCSSCSGRPGPARARSSRPCRR
ncbi:FtsK/SpoIIIE domain-containing protein [Sinomonas atrocyanea]